LPVVSFLSVGSNVVTEVFKNRVVGLRGLTFLIFRKSSRVQNMVHEIKYKGNKDLAFYLGILFARHVKNQLIGLNNPLVVAVPLHKVKLKKRGYNQSEWIAKGFAKELGCECDFSILHRIQFADSQTTKGRYERWVNLENNFTISEGVDLTGKTVLLIDDVLTTGSTMEQCYRELKRTNAKEVLLGPLCIVIG
jgi:ComF family protein